MCSPHIMAHVQKRLQAKLSRRDMLKSGLIAGSAALAAQLPSAKAYHASKTIAVTNLSDLTHSLSESFPVFPAFEPMKITTLVTVENDGFYVNRLDLGEHTGTHLDAPAHFIADGITSDQIALENFIVPLVVIDISAKAANNPDAAVAVSDIIAWESEHGTLPENAGVMMYSGWENRLSDAASYVNMGEEGMKFPGFSKEAAEFLVNERSIAGVGVDTLSIDVGSSSTFDVHVTILGAGKWGLENVANLAKAPVNGAHLIIGNIKVENGSGGPVRLIAAW
ncbi:MAG: cyclase family protein [Deinococcales bacterium]